MAASPALTVQHLLDRAAIGDVVHDYATGVDRRDWPLYRSVFTDRVDFDFPGWLTQPDMAADDWVAQVRANLSGFDATQHRMTNQVITLDGDRAEIVVSMVARHVLQGEMQMLGGYYTDRMIRTGSGWKIAGCALVTTWEQGDRALFARARARIDGVAGA